MAQSSLFSELLIYVGRVRQFGPRDWLVYVSWVGLMFGLVASTGGFLLCGHAAGVMFPLVAWWVPLGALGFSVSIAIDTVGHRTIYKQEIRGAEGLVHGITIACGIGSCVLLCAAYSHPAAWIPAAVLTALSFLYSLVDEVFHWRRYVHQHSDRIEMSSHVGILAGHGILMLGWWSWYLQGYPGVAETLAAFRG